MVKKAAVVGAGISGLYTCLLLEKNGYTVDLYEKSSTIGGRMSSEKKSGFILDRGFHVMQTGYPLASSVFDYEKMGCKAFEPGALIIRPNQNKPKVWRFADPFRRPLKGILSVFSLFTTPLNLLRVGLLRMKLSRIKDVDIFKHKSQTTLEFLSSRGFSESFIQSFFSPLFGGIFLESELRTDARMFRFVFKNMSRGNMVLPKEGISACPKQLFERLENTSLNLNSNVSLQSEIELIHEGQNHVYEVIFKAFATKNEPSRDVWTIHFAAPKSPLSSKYIMLNSALKSEDKLISHLAVPSDIQPSYAPENQALVTVTVIGEDAKKHGLTDGKSVEKSVISELSTWFPKQISSWKTINVQHIEAALPELTGQHFDNLTKSSNANLCGDQTYHGSVEGALISAQIAVDEFLKNAA